MFPLKVQIVSRKRDKLCVTAMFQSENKKQVFAGLLSERCSSVMSGPERRWTLGDPPVWPERA